MENGSCGFGGLTVIVLLLWFFGVAGLVVEHVVLVCLILCSGEEACEDVLR